MINSTAIASETKVAAASRRCVLASCGDSPAIVSETPTNASQSHNVRKCPVLSGLTDCSGETDASTDSHKTYDQTSSHLDRTSARSRPTTRILDRLHPL